jgi:hypothetical protein
MDLTSGPKNGTVPLHPGAVRFFTEAGVLKPMQKASLPPMPAARKS